MRFCLLLTGTASDGAALTVLAEAAPFLTERTWSVMLDMSGPGSALACEALDAVLADRLLPRGLPLATAIEQDETLVLTPLRGGPPARWDLWKERSAPRLVEALRLRRVPGEPLVDEALFVMRADSEAPRLLIERLLLLGRSDAQVVSFVDEAAGSFAVKVKAPPIYLMMAARDGGGEVAVYGRHGASSLWVAWSFEHPAAGAAAASLARVNQAALVDRDGQWVRTPAEWRARAILDAAAPELEAPRVAMRSVASEVRFRVPIRLAPAALTDPDLWLLTPEQLLELEPLIEVSTADELSRLTVARLTGADGTVYLLRERVRPGAARMAGRVSDTLGVPGYSQVAGADNLYVPTGRRLMPVLRRDDLRALLGLERAHTVVITEDHDGPRVVTIVEVDEQPLQRWIDYVATDRRLELDKLLERSVFEFPEVTIEWPKEARQPAPKRPQTREGPVKRAPPPKPVVVEEPASAIDVDAAAHLRALREQVRALERRVVAGGCEEPEVWQELGEIKAALGDGDEAADCFEMALLHGGPPYDAKLAARLLSATRGSDSDDALMEWVVADRRTPADASRLGASLVARVATQRPPADELMQLALPIFADPRLPVSRRLAWAVLAGWHRHARDRLGITRAKEAILGGINERGLSELHDLPRFVRHALAREGDDHSDESVEARADRLQQGQLVALEAMWHEAAHAGLPEMDAPTAFMRLIFAVGFARLGARGLAQELIAPVELEIDVHEVPNRALFRLYMARLAHESSGGSPEVWAAEVARTVESVRDPRMQQAVTWLQKRSMWLRTTYEEESAARTTRFKLPAGVDVSGLADVVAREVSVGTRSYDYLIAEAVDVCVRRALASGSDAVVAEVLASAEPGLGNIQILSHRAEAVAACIHGAASLGDDAMLGRLLETLVNIARSEKLGSARELVRATQRGLAALRRFGGLEPARALLEALARVHAYTSSDQIALSATVATGFVQIGEERVADEVLDTLCTQVLGGSLDYVTRAQGGLAVAQALRHWPNMTRVERFRRFVAELAVFRDTFTASRYYDTHKILILEAIVDSLADSRTRHSDRVQGFLDQEEHALRRRIVTDWSAVCGR
ncbi:hypothetical protein SAMN02745121_03197 [Nannocystis exedens]|uniref:FtsH ternary system domain-containing protein n=1 Tax=Nannocystis exedens TaxID=54 RepID=A0A1I1Y730_9BACT|nr:hypothetical protein [Nannocystis exedens]PCC71845.1 hypothetical protein NAEX_04924 [Nannocystis exedens]SFE15122.1 hypothetical protein SAMN02745121_03197 [Nannocystis exedens]